MAQFTHENTNTAKLTTEEYRAAGRSHLEHMRELLAKHGDAARIDFHASHIRAV